MISYFCVNLAARWDLYQKCVSGDEPGPSLWLGQVLHARKKLFCLLLFLGGGGNSVVYKSPSGKKYLRHLVKCVDVTVVASLLLKWISLIAVVDLLLFHLLCVLIVGLFYWGWVFLLKKIFCGEDSHHQLDKTDKLSTDLKHFRLNRKKISCRIYSGRGWTLNIYHSLQLLSFRMFNNFPSLE